jgi:hypothetical protein
MGGPSPDSYRAEQQRERARRAALRTRDGVVDLAEWRAAVRAAAGLARFLDGPPPLGRVTVGVAADAGCELRVTLRSDSRVARVRVPTAFNGVPVLVLNARRAGATKGGDDVRPPR